MNVKSLSTIAEKFARVTPGRAADYANGVETTTKDWAAATKAAEASYGTGVQAAVAAGRFGKGVTKAGTEKFKRGVREKGSARFAAGVAVAGDAYAQGFSPYHNALSATALPPRRARRDPSNMQRVQAVVTAMVKTFESGAK
jgi:hypothetical protein